MSSFNRKGGFDPLDLEIIDLVFEVAWARFEALEPDRDRSNDDERATALREHIFALAGCAPVEFDALSEKVLASNTQKVAARSL